MSAWSAEAACQRGAGAACVGGKEGQRKAGREREKKTEGRGPGFSNKNQKKFNIIHHIESYSLYIEY